MKDQIKVARMRVSALTALALSVTAGVGLAFIPGALAQTTQLLQSATPEHQMPGAFSDREAVPQDLARIDQALNGTQSFFGRFMQYGSDGSVAQGQIYLKRPGKMRFEYDQPNPLLIVSDGVTLTQVDKALETVDRVPLSATPLNFFLKENVQLARDTEIVGLIKSPSEMRVTARDGSGELDGDLTLVFDRSNLSLKGWMIADSFGNQTQVVLSGLKYNQNLDPRLFVLRDDSRRDRRR